MKDKTKTLLTGEIQVTLFDSSNLRIDFFKTVSKVIPKLTVSQ